MFIEKLLKIFDIKGKYNTEKPCTAEDAAIIRALREARNDWQQALLDFDNVKDEEIIDYCTYRIKACQVRYEYFLREAKKRGITLTMNEEVHHLTGITGTVLTITE